MPRPSVPQSRIDEARSLEARGLSVSEAAREAGVSRAAVRDRQFAPSENPTIFLAPSGSIAVEIPSVLAEGRSHTVEIPLTLAGLSLLKKILVDRQRAARPTIGMMASPVASDIAAFLAKRDREDRANAKANAEAVAKRYALEDVELEL